MLKIIIVGSPGAGKSTFARKLRDITGIPLFYLDMLWHKPDRTTVTQEEFNNRLNGILQKDRWIIDGNYQRTLEPRLQACDTVFLMDFPLETCISGAESRIGNKQWIQDFPKNRLPQLYEMIETYKDNKEIMVFHSRKEADDYLAAMKK